MPTATSLSQLSFTNLGPLTTTFTAPASCATDSNPVVLGFSASPDILQWNTDCDFHTIADCIPSASAINSQASALKDWPLAGYVVQYYSPGLFCPESWTTAGLAVKDAQGAVSSAGAFVPTLTGPLPTVHNLPPDVFMSILEPGETAVLCCPSAFTVDQVGMCHSVIPDYVVTAGCARMFPSGVYTIAPVTFTEEGTVVTGEVFTITNTASVTAWESRTLEPSDMSSYVGVKVIPMITLVQREGDVPLQTPTPTPTPAPSTSSSAAVSARQPSQGGWRGVMGMAAMCAVAAMLGAAVIVPL